MIIPANWSLPDSIRNRISQTTYGRQRAIVEDGHVLIILHKPPGPDDRTRDSVLFWRNPAGEWHFNRGATGSGNTALKRHVQTYVDVEAKLTQDYEKAAGTEALFNLLEELTPMSRATENMYLALQAAREAVKGDLFLIEVRDLAYEVSRNIDLLLEDGRARNSNIARVVVVVTQRRDDREPVGRVELGLAEHRVLAGREAASLQLVDLLRAQSNERFELVIV